MLDNGLFRSAVSAPIHYFCYTPDVDLYDLAACYAFHLTKNHSFEDGNKRTALAAPGENLPRGARWVDALGLDSEHDYDPLWRRFVELDVTPTFHSTGMGWGSRTSPTSYVANHVGSFGAAGEASVDRCCWAECCRVC